MDATRTFLGSLRAKCDKAESDVGLSFARARLSTLHELKVHGRS
jgi:hypothetical protein